MYLFKVASSPKAMYISFFETILYFYGGDEMKAILATQYGGPEVLHYTDVDRPEPQSSQVLIRVVKTSVNFADIKTRKGKKGGGGVPYIPGLDAAGVIEQIGSNVQRFQVGQRVVAFPSSGSYAEYAVADENLTFALPDSIDFDMAASCPIVSFLAYNLLADIARMETGERVLIHSAAGGVGTTAIQLAKLLGAGEIIGTVGNLNKASIALEAGADHVLSYEDADFAHKVNEVTGGQGVDIVLDSVAGWVTEKSLECLAPYGRLVQFGNSSGVAGKFTSNDVHSSCRSVLGYSFGTTRKRKPHLVEATAKKVFPYLSTGQLKIKIGHTYSLQEAAIAHQLIESRLSTGKVILDING
jgi:NADPH:quinone reductase